MGQASRRGTFEERKAQGIARREEQLKIDRDARHRRSMELDDLLDRQESERCTSVATKQPDRILVVDDGYRRRSRGHGSIMLMAAMLAATAGIGVIDIPSERRYR